MFVEAVLFLWIFVGIAFFALMPPLRAFLLTYIIGYLLLPTEIGEGTNFIGTIYISQSLQIDKLTACNLGALLGTLLFVPGRFGRWRWHWVDSVYGLLLLSTFLSSLLNGLGPKDGISHVVEELRLFFPIVLLSRVYLQTASDLHQAMRAMIAGAFLYSFLAVAEWRFSPQAHRLLYGYFQHAFDQFTRYSHFRPVGFLRHAIELSFFLGTTTALAGWLWYRRLLQPLWGFIPPSMVVLTLLIGLASTMTFSGYAAFLLCCGIFFLVAMTWSRWCLMVLPIFAVVWMGGRYTGVIDAHYLRAISTYFDPARTESLDYRLESEQIHLQLASNRLFLGTGANGMADGGNSTKAVDAWWIITLVFYGVVGITLRYLFWSAGLVDAWRRWRYWSPDLQTLAAAVSVLLGAQFIDFLFNAFPSPFLLIFDMGLLATLQAFQPAASMYEIPAEWTGTGDSLLEGAVPQ